MSTASLRSGGTLLLVLALLSLGACANEAERDKAKKAVAAAPRGEEVDEAEDEEAELEAAEPAAVPARPEEAAAPAGVEIDPARMPIEEDFVREAESRISKNANLAAELDRIAAELRAPRN